MNRTAVVREKKRETTSRSKRETPWNVILHNDWENSMPRVVLVLRRVIPGMTLSKAARIMYEAHTAGRAVVKSCHRELAELYGERLLAEGLTASTEKAG
jgi:ATP-dependent Clp protease adaptor protein ClpS